MPLFILVSPSADISMSPTSSQDVWGILLKLQNPDLLVAHQAAYDLTARINDDPEHCPALLAHLFTLPGFVPTAVALAKYTVSAIWLLVYLVDDITHNDERVPLLVQAGAIAPLVASLKPLEPQPVDARPQVRRFALQPLIRSAVLCPVELWVRGRGRGGSTLTTLALLHP